MMGTLKISGIEVEADTLHDTLRVLVEPPAGHRVLEHQEDRGQLAWTLDSGWTDPERIDGEPLLWSAPIACGGLADGLRYRGLRESARAGDVLACDFDGMQLWTRRMSETERASMRRLEERVSAGGR